MRKIAGDGMDPGQPALQISQIKWGINLFIMFTVVGMLVVLYRSSLADCLVHLSGFKLPYLALAAALVVFEWLASGAQTYMFASRVHPGITYVACVRASLANTFMAGLTPSQTGGAAAQIFVLYKEGMPVVGATVASFLGGFLSTSVCLTLAALLATVLVPPQFASAGLQLVSTISVVIFSMVIVLVLVSLANPRKFPASIYVLLRASPRVKRWLQRTRILSGLFNAVRTYHDIMIHFLTRARLVLLFGILLSSVTYFSRFLVAYVVLEGLGLEAEFWPVIYTQFMLFLAFFFAPTPGASGFAEIITTELMGQLIPLGYQGAFLLLWRFFTLFCGMIVGAAVTLPYLCKPRNGRRALCGPAMGWHEKSAEQPAGAGG